MKPNYTHFSVIMDRSGSMSGIKRDTEGGLNTFFEDQKKVDGTATVSLTIFDDQIDSEYSFLDLKEVPQFVLHPRGGTALLDAIGITITKLGEKLASMNEKDRPEKVMVVIVTDGEENSSKEYTLDRIKAMITEQEEAYKWEFVFLAANQDAITTAGSMGIKGSKAMTYATTSKGIGDTYDSLSTQVSCFRSMKASDATFAFSDADRAKQAEEGVI
jgi:uncharacterized protein YegL